MNRPILKSLTSLRYFAAVIVLIHHSLPHWRNIYIIEAIGNIGYLGVPFFFTLSGFVLYYTYDSKINFRDYIINRFSKIYPLHVIMLLLCIITYYKIGDPIAGLATNILGTIRNITLIQSWQFGNINITAGWNGVSWTLSCEFLFYIVAPFIFYLIRCNANKLFLLIIVFCYIFEILLLTLNINNDYINNILWYSPLSGILAFTLGAYSAHAFTTKHIYIKLNIMSFLSLIILLLPCSLYLIYTPHLLQHGSLAALLTYPAVCLILILQANRDVVSNCNILKNSILVKLGDASFALYMIHAWLLGVWAIIINKYILANNMKLVHFIVHYNIYKEFNFLLIIIFIIVNSYFSIYINIWVEIPLRSLFRKLCKKCIPYKIRLT
jgi:peptidoglycan/LPS O-acetylase OafA/YrhL